MTFLHSSQLSGRSWGAEVAIDLWVVRRKLAACQLGEMPVVSTMFVRLDMHCTWTIPGGVTWAASNTESSKLCRHEPNQLVTPWLIHSTYTCRYNRDMRLLPFLIFSVLFHILHHWGARKCKNDLEYSKIWLHSFCWERGVHGYLSMCVYMNEYSSSWMVLSVSRLDILTGNILCAETSSGSERKH